MTYTQALTEARRLAEYIRARGVPVSIEIMSGVSTSGWYDDRKVGILAHHIVSRRTMGLTPFLSLVKRGRTDVPGPLCNGYGGFDEVYRIITMGWANHPGAGGPLTLAGYRIPQDNGRPYLWGTEFEGGLDLADFTPSYRRFMSLSHLGVLDYLNRPIEAHGEHKTWAPYRKIDRLGYTTESGRNELRAFDLDLPTPIKIDPLDPFMEDDMQRAIEGFYEKYLGRRASRGEVNDQLAASIDLGLRGVRDGIANSAEAKAFAALPAAEQAARRAKAQAVEPAGTVVANVTASIDYAALAAAFHITP